LGIYLRLSTEYVIWFGPFGYCISSLMVSLINYEFVSEFFVDDIFDLSKVLELVEGKPTTTKALFKMDSQPLLLELSGKGSQTT
jgi:hypothetical protein